MNHLSINNTEAPARKKKLIVLGMGGTIAGLGGSHLADISYQAACLDIVELLKASQFGLPADVELIAEQLAQIDSKDMSFDLCDRLARRVTYWLTQEEVQGVVITHGTDTLEESAFFLHLLIPASLQASKPVVFTCAMRPANALLADGPQNLKDACCVALWSGACGVLAVMGGTVHDAVHVEKIHSFRMDAFSSGDAGPIALVEGPFIRQFRPWPTQIYCVKSFDPAISSQQSGPWPRVEIILSYVGAGAGIVHALIQDGIHGLVVAATGNGSVHFELSAALLAAQTAGLPVIVVTRCQRGRVVSDKARALDDLTYLSAIKARIALTAQLHYQSDEQAIG